MVNPARASLTPIPFLLPPHRLACRVLHLEPVWGSEFLRLDTAPDARATGAQHFRAASAAFAVAAKAGASVYRGRLKPDLCTLGLLLSPNQQCASMNSSVTDTRGSAQRWAA
jgi:hypothetical protein